MDRRTQASLKNTFDRVASAYAASRPAYPAEAVDWLVGDQQRDVLDLAAGNGALTRSLVPRAARVVAVDPSANLLAALSASTPQAYLVRAAAEALPFAGATYDIVTVATAFHWFDPDRALPEIARVLRPGGVLGLLWNTRVAEEPWTRELAGLLRRARPATLQGDWGAGSAQALVESPLFENAEYAEFRHGQRLDRAGLVDLVASRSYVVALDPPQRKRLLAQVGDLFDTSATPGGFVELPYRCQCWRAHRGRFTPI